MGLTSETMSESRRYDMKIMYSVEVTDPVALIAAAYARWCAKATAVEEFTEWHREQWQRWVDDATTDPKDDPAWGPDRRGVDVALHEFIGPDHRLDDNIPGAVVRHNGSHCAEDTFPWPPEDPATSRWIGIG
jgi:hypothetical protein